MVGQLCTICTHPPAAKPHVWELGETCAADWRSPRGRQKRATASGFNEKGFCAFSVLDHKTDSCTQSGTDKQGAISLWAQEAWHAPCFPKTHPEPAQVSAPAPTHGWL